MKNINEFRFGLNYVPSKRWYYCWNDFKADEIAEDLDAVAACGADHIRLMTIWSFFHPDPDWVSPAHLKRLGVVMDLAKERGIDVLVTAFNGWLTGHKFVPSWQKNREFYTDTFMNEKQEFYLRELAKTVAGRENFIGFDLGNEMNCCWGAAEEHGTAWSTRMLKLCNELAPEAIHVNGVNHAPFFKKGTFSAEALARDQKIVSLHAWVEFTGALKRGGPLSPQSVQLAAAMTAIAKAYAHDPAKPVWIQEFGASEDWMSAEIIPDFMEQTIRNAVKAGATWFTWWCSHDITREFCMEELEYTLGLMTINNKRKPQAETFRKLAEEFRSQDPADIQIPEIPSPPENYDTETTWQWIEDWIKDK
ncbi:MAG: glycoside hydrolase 5 family protein [Candidatus Sumerlaeia bacterium]